MRQAMLAIICVVASLTAQARTARPASPARAASPEVSAKLTRKTFDIKSHPFPSWTVELTIANKTAQPISVGSVLAVLATSATTDGFVATVVERRPAREEARHLRVAERYGFDWGVDVPAEGSTLWPVAALAPKSLSAVDRFLLVLAAPSIEALAGGGYGTPIPAGQSRTITETVLFPYDAEIKGERNAIIVVPPVLRAADGAPLSLGVFHFAVSGIATTGQTFPGQREAFSLTSAGLARTASEESPVWRRVLATNWLAESHPASATGTLLHLGTDETAPLLVRHAALLNLGLNKVKSAPPRIVETLGRAAQRSIRYCSIIALSDIGDATAAPAVRPFISDADDLLARAAMEAAGSFRDSAAVPALLAVLADAKMEERQVTAAAALGAIGDVVAVDGLLDAVRNRKAAFQARRGAAIALGERKTVAAIPALAAVAADEKEPDAIRSNMIDALVQVATSEAIAAVLALADSRNQAVRRDAINALVRVEDPMARGSVIAIAGQSGAPAREDAIRALAGKKVAHALPAFRAAAGDANAPRQVRIAAVGGLADLNDATARESLASTLNDRDEDLYEAGITAFVRVFRQESLAEAAAALKSRSAKVRRASATAIAKEKLFSGGALWEAYQAERDKAAGQAMATALIEGGFADSTAVPLLVRGLDAKKNPLWFQHVRLLRHLTKQGLGPQHEYGSEQERSAAFHQWREWCTASGHCR